MPVSRRSFLGALRPNAAAVAPVVGAMRRVSRMVGGEARGDGDAVRDRLVDRHTAVAPARQVQPMPSFQRLADCLHSCEVSQCALRDSNAVPDDASENGWRRDGKTTLKVRRHDGQELGVIQCDDIRIVRPADDGTQQDMACRRARREDARFPQHPQRPQPLATRHEKAEAIERVGNGRPRIAKGNDSNRRRRNHTEQRRKR